MRSLLIISFIITCVSYKAIAQHDTIVVNRAKFITIVQAAEGFDGSIDTLAKLYRIRNGKREYLLTHYLYKFGADCNNEFTDKGTIMVQGDSLVFYTEYLQQTGLDPLPRARRQVYKVSDEGKLTEVYDKEQQRSGEWVDVPDGG